MSQSVKNSIDPVDLDCIALYLEIKLPYFRYLTVNTYTNSLPEIYDGDLCERMATWAVRTQSYTLHHRQLS